MLILKEKKKSKLILRHDALEKRRLFASSGMLQKNSSIIVSKILNSELFNNSKHVALYIPIKNEVDITPILRVHGKTFYLPACVNNKLEFRMYDNTLELKKGLFNIPESTLAAINPNILDLIYIPALLANNMCYRLGYGKGFYDRFFVENNLKAKKIIVIQSAFIDDGFVQDSFDIRCDGVISEN